MRDARHGPEVVLDAFLSALSRGDGATVFGLTGAEAGSGARALADAVGGSLFSPGDDEEAEEIIEGESVPPWLRGSDGSDDEPSSPSPSPSARRRFPRELEPLVALFFQGSNYDLLSVKMLSQCQAWGMAGVRPLGDDGSGFILGGGNTGAGAPPPPPPPSAPSSSSSPSSSPVERNGRKSQKQWQEELQLSELSRAAFIFRLELCAADGCWEVRDIARVGGGGSGGSGGAFSLDG